jgi:hypothetical protein
MSDGLARTLWIQLCRTQYPGLLDIAVLEYCVYTQTVFVHVQNVVLFVVIVNLYIQPDISFMKVIWNLKDIPELHDPKKMVNFL